MGVEEDFILDMRVVNTDKISYVKNYPEKSLVKANWEKRCKYLNVCLQQQRYFSHSFVLVDVLLCTKSEETLKRFARSLATKWWQAYSMTCGYVRIIVAITMVRDTHLCI